jgi:hypothetical protein
MEFVIVVIAAAAVVIIWVRRRKKRTKESLHLTLAVVGFEASGKSVYAGSMFHELRVPDAHGVFLDTTPEKAGKLLALYSTTADPDKKFPSSTNKGELIEWPFTVKVRSAATVIDIGKFCYLDFAGESLRELYTAAPNPETQRLYRRFADADILMAALDGLQVKRYLENRPLPGFYQDLGTLLALLSNHQKVANLILTKWDILEDHYTFRQVAERLFQINQFAGFVRAQQSLGVCRLIPVSSVGPGFACEDGNAMRKIPGKVINPVRVDVPIASVLPDALTTARQRSSGSPGRAKMLVWARAMKLNLGMLQIDLGSFIQSEPSYLTPTPSTPATIGQLIRYCEGRLGQLERDFPESNLVRFMIQRGI